jgi:hypothetical protein
MNVWIVMKTSYYENYSATLQMVDVSSSTSVAYVTTDEAEANDYIKRQPKDQWIEYEVDGPHRVAGDIGGVK